MRNVLTRIDLLLVLLVSSSPLWAQADPTGGTSSDAMVSPTPVSGEGYSLEFASETPRSNYLSGGLNLGAAYGNGVLSTGASDVSYSVSPNIAFDETRSRYRWNLSYSPGFTFYQKYSSLNQSNQNLGTRFSYRLSPHVTFNAQETFTKTVGGDIQFCEIGTGGLCGLPQSPNNSILAPNTDTLNDASSAQLTYQFSPGGMVGLTGNFSELHYPNQGQVPGLNDSNAAGGGAFYTHRISGKHYIGATYQYQKFGTHPEGQGTLAQSLMFFYTFYLQRSVSFSLSGGPQYSETSGLGIPSLHSWSPGGSGSINWQGQHNSLVAGYSRRINDAGGLQGAVSYNDANSSIRHQFSAALSGTLAADYTVNKVLDPAAFSDTSGHSISGTAMLVRSLGPHFNLTGGYLRLYQSYNIKALSIVPDRDRVWLSIGYQFQRSLGR
jgi:hypothetical protein